MDSSTAPNGQRQLRAVAILLAVLSVLLAAVVRRGSSVSAGQAPASRAARPPPRRNAPSRAATWLLAAFAVALIVSAFGLLAWRLSARDAPTTGRTSTAFEMQRISDDRRSSALLSDCGGSPLPLVLLTISEVAPQRGELTAQLGLCIPASTARQFASSFDGASIVSGSRRTRRIQERFRSARFTVYVFGHDPIAAAVATARVADVLGGRAVSGFTPLSPGSVTLPLVGRADAYPLDRLSTDSAVYVARPEGFRPTPMQPEGARWTDLVPARLVVRAEPVVGDFDIDYGLDEASPIDARSFRIVIQREASARAYVAVVLLTPLLLAFALALMLLTRGGGADVRNLLIGVAGATFALLPLRAVLVPQDITGQTLVDWCLGSELLVFVAIGLMGLARSLRAHDDGALVS